MYFCVTSFVPVDHTFLLLDRNRMDPADCYIDVVYFLISILDLLYMFVKFRAEICFGKVIHDYNKKIN